jgi:hypothetical protein
LNHLVLGLGEVINDLGDVPRAFAGAESLLRFI